MKIIIFAGGIGTRMWPVSRIKTPKQFNPLLDGKSTVELMVDHVLQKVPQSDIFISTNHEYTSIIAEKLPQIPSSQIFQEPAMRDLGPAVGYAISVLNNIDPEEPVAILWSDDLIKNRSAFVKVLDFAQQQLHSNPDQIVYIGQKPLFADQNKGWIHFGQAIKHSDGISIHEFIDWHYRPPLELAQQYFQSNDHAINTGYFVSTPRFISSLYSQYAPKMHQVLSELASSWGQDNHMAQMHQLYPNLDKISFDDLIVSKTKPEDGIVMVTDMGWYGFGDWEAIKEALQVSPNDNVTNGRVFAYESKDCLIYNYTNQLITPVGLEGMIVVATPDAIMVCPKKSIPEVKSMLKQFANTDFDKYT